MTKLLNILYFTSITYFIPFYETFSCGRAIGERVLSAKVLLPYLVLPPKNIVSITVASKSTTRKESRSERHWHPET